MMDVARLESTGHLVLEGGARCAGRLAALIDRGREFFARCAAQRDAAFGPELVSGYRGIGVEYAVTPERPDLMESLSLSLAALRELAPRVPDGSVLHAGMLDVMHELEGMVAGVLDALCRRYLGHGAAVFRHDRSSFLQLSFYRPGAHTRELLQDRHEDANLFTLVHATEPGLELEDCEERYHPVRLHPGQLLVMPGELLALFTGHRIKPLYHRVRNHPEVDTRLSVMLFVNPNLDERLEPWVRNAYNEGIDLVRRAILNPVQFGLPALRVPAQCRNTPHDVVPRTGAV
jgi:isopenicillin N synthase-like dioxygenase